MKTKKCKDTKLFVIQLIIIFIGAIACCVSMMFFTQRPTLYAVCFDAGVVILIFCLSTFLKTNHSARGVLNSYIFALIPYIIFMIFFRKSNVVIDLIIAFVTAIILLIIHFIRENKFCESYLEYIVKNAEEFVDNYDDMIDNVHSMYDSMRTLYDNIAEPFNIELGKMDDIEYYDMPERPYEMYYSYNVLHKYMWELNMFIYQVASLSDELERKSDIMEAEIEYRQNQYNNINIFDEICQDINSDEIKQILKNKLSDFKWEIFCAFEKDNKPLIECLKHKVKFTKYKNPSPNSIKVMRRANQILTEGAQYGLRRYGSSKKDINNRYLKIATEHPEVAVDMAQSLLHWGRNKFEDMRDNKNKKYIEDTQNYIVEIRDKTNKQIEELTSYYNEIKQFVKREEISVTEISDGIENLTNDYIQKLNNIM